jgi:uncharacterized protein (DUF1697 family)
LRVAEYIAFLRAINVGGSSIVRMADLREAFVTAGCRNVRSYIASGNILFESGVSNDVALVRRVRRAIADRLEMNPAIMLRTLKELEALVARDPFRKLRQDRTAKFYVAFLAERPAASVKIPLTHEKEALDVIGVTGRDAFIVSRPKPNGFYGFPNNFLEQSLGAVGTTRNWSTVSKVVDFARRGERTE